MAFFSFETDFVHLQGADRRQWLAKSQKYYLHIFLRRVDDAPRGRHTQIAFLTARVGDIDSLPSDYPVRIRSRVETRFPSVCLGYSVVDSLSDSQIRVTTVTHSIPWPEAGSKVPRIPYIMRSIWLKEWILRKD